ncbi:hypothetical protein [Brachybacterium fresconis]|uniref:LPXTG cell wall anchor domain-containing protein n=1 Tax=Brachybacterium fresconis TaxID=173363 RepID=A0ABS4YGG0_9MICO|nr:hypothetical protein [Brachybacterium fresconis]MBP2407883.1 hypothetical protein [Brachybacterium fresconis]
MIDQLMILAETGENATGGVTPPMVGIGVFIILMILLGLTYLTGGTHQRKRGKSDQHGDD